MSNKELHKEKELLQLIAIGDEAAFSRLFDNYGAPTYAHVISFLKNASLAEEVTQDIFLKIWEVRNELPQLESFRNFLFIVARNRILSELRKKPQLLENTSLDHLQENLLKPDEQLRYKEFHGQVMQAIEKLSPQKKMVFKMSRLENLSRAEIVARTGLSYGTVNQYLVDAVIFLKTHLKDTTSYDFLLLLGMITLVLEK